MHYGYKIYVHTGFCWNVGKWEIIDNKYLFLKVIEVNDKIIGEKQYVLSHDKISDSTTLQKYAILSLQGGGQSRNLPPNKFLIKEEIFYPYFKDGKLRDQKERSLNGNLKGKPWFEKVAR